MSLGVTNADVVVRLHEKMHWGGKKNQTKFTKFYHKNECLPAVSPLIKQKFIVKVKTKYKIHVSFMLP